VLYVHSGLRLEFPKAAKVTTIFSAATFLARQVYPEHSQSLYNLFRNATERPHGYFILEFAQDTDVRLRFRTNVFPDECPPAVYAPINDETDTVQLS